MPNASKSMHLVTNLLRFFDLNLPLVHWKISGCNFPSTMKTQQLLMTSLRVFSKAVLDLELAPLAPVHHPGPYTQGALPAKIFEYNYNTIKQNQRLLLRRQAYVSNKHPM